MGAKVPQPSRELKPSRAALSSRVGATRLTLMRRPVRLVGSAKVATSFGCGISGSGRRDVSKMILGPSPAGVRRTPSGAVSMAHPGAIAQEIAKTNRSATRHTTRGCIAKFYQSLGRPSSGMDRAWGAQMQPRDTLQPLAGLLVTVSVEA